MQMFDCLQVSNRCAPYSRHTHSTKYFSCHMFQLHTLGGILLHIVLVTPVSPVICVFLTPMFPEATEEIILSPWEIESSLLS
jgi:hypothetical protein